MRVIEISRPGGPEVLRPARRPVPVPGPGEVLIRVLAAGVNRPDIQQRRGLYPPPPGASDLPGLEVAGRIAAVGPGVETPAPGTAVCALVNGGGYAEFVAVPAVQCMPVPDGFTFLQAAALPEVFMTAWQNLVVVAGIAPGERLLVQGGTSGVGLAAIQIARVLRGAIVYATAGTEEKRAVCRAVGAAAAYDYRAAWDDELTERIGPQALDVILDAQAGPQVQRQLALLARRGRLVLLASHQGAVAEVDVRALVRRRLTLTGSTLRPESAATKGRLAAALVAEVWPALASGRIRNHIHAVLPLAEVAEAHGLLDANLQIGKVVLAVDAAEADTCPTAAERPAPHPAPPDGEC